MSKINPTDRKYSKDHEWIRVDGEGTAWLGITDHAQEMLTDIVFVELPEIGRKVQAGEAVAVIESVKSVSDVYSPIGGEVIEANQLLESKPEQINKDAFGEGWIVRLKIVDTTELNSLMSAEEYEMTLTETTH
ncbi:MAG TPA: glycine cleavage system protein GcvH [Smithellaceae bacterium]|nr:glycine cleavage system protein GcvH [Smithellaceae bacterium]